MVYSCVYYFCDGWQLALRSMITITPMSFHNEYTEHVDYHVNTDHHNYVRILMCFQLPAFMILE